MLFENDFTAADILEINVVTMKLQNLKIQKPLTVKGTESMCSSLEADRDKHYCSFFDIFSEYMTCNSYQHSS